MMSRKEANMEIIRLLVNYINENPDQRFSQVLLNLGAVTYDMTLPGASVWLNEFYKEPLAVLERMKKMVNGI